MQIIRCTQKLLKELKVKPVDNIQPIKNLLGGWHANLLLVQRRKCVLVINDSTLYTFFIPFLKKADFENFDHVFQQNLFKNLLHEHCSQKQIEAVLTENEKIIISKSNNRSVLGSMNQQKMQLEYRIYFSGGLKYTPIFELNKELNRHLIDSVEFKHPYEKLKKKLEKFK